MSIDLSALPRHVTVAVGGRREIPLPSYAGSGNAWSATPVSGEEVARVSVELGGAPAAPMRPADGTAEPPALVMVPEVAVVVGLARGEATWRLVLARSFDPAHPTATHELRVTVVDNP
ncbi:MAG TPA: hypothetical protein VH482_29635 [Thermomicrobiales bacterium]|jgi:hypothetical protein